MTASMADKDVDGVIDALRGSEALRGASVIATSLDMTRALAATALADRWRAVAADWVRDIAAVEDPREALDRALGRAGPTVVAGSLYLVGAVRAQLVDDPELRDPAPGRAVP